MSQKDVAAYPRRWRRQPRTRGNASRPRVTSARLKCEDCQRYRRGGPLGTRQGSSVAGGAHHGSVLDQDRQDVEQEAQRLVRTHLSDTPVELQRPGDRGNARDELDDDRCRPHGAGAPVAGGPPGAEADGDLDEQQREDETHVPGDAGRSPRGALQDDREQTHGEYTGEEESSGTAASQDRTAVTSMVVWTERGEHCRTSASAAPITAPVRTWAVARHCVEPSQRTGRIQSACA